MVAPPLTGVIYLSLLSKQPISVRCHPPNGGFYLNKEKWPKSQRSHSNTGYCQISAHTPEMGSLRLPPNIQIWGQIFGNPFLVRRDEPWLEWPAEWFSKLTQIFLASPQWVGHREVGWGGGFVMHPSTTHTLLQLHNIWMLSWRYCSAYSPQHSISITTLAFTQLTYKAVTYFEL